MVHFVTTHLDYQHDDGRLFEAQQMLAILSDVKGPLIVLGIFNDIPHGPNFSIDADANLTMRGDGRAARR